MKKILLYSLMFMTSMTFWSCKDDDDNGGTSSDRLARPMFITEEITNSSSYEYNCKVVDLNNISLNWYTVNDAVAYEIKWAIQPYVSAGEQAWIDTENGVDGKSLAGHIVISDPKQYNVLVEHLQYQTQYMFAIRALNSFDATGYSLYYGQNGVYDILGSGDANWKNDSKNSNWYGVGNLREWADFYRPSTDARYEVPFVVQASEITKTGMHLTLNRSIAKGYSDDQLTTFREHFNFLDADKTILKIDYLTVTASISTPNAKENPVYTHYEIPESAWDENNICELDIDGLSENSVYVIDVWDKTITIPVDACYNSTMKRTKGDPAPPILLTHVPTATSTQANFDGEITGDISQWNSMELDQIIADYCASNESAENQVFYLEGGKAYHFAQNPSVYKGLTLRTNPEDVAQGKRAKLYLGGLLKLNGNSTFCNFMIGRQPNAGENSTITLDIDSVRFMDLDVDCPYAGNYGSATEGGSGASGNYFMNMYSNGMGVNVNYLEWSNCTFQGIVRGFFRTQGSNDFYFQKIVLKDCQFYNGGYYQQNGGGFNYFHCDHGTKPKSNILKNIEISGCVFYDSPHGALITDNNKNNTWDESVRWNIDVHHNTFVNWLTRSNSVIINTRYVPGGSELGFHDNVVILTKDPADINRNMGSAGWDVRNIQGGDGTGVVTFNIYNNWTTDDEWNTNGQPFAANALNAKSNAPGKFLSTSIYPYGEEELTVHLEAGMKATDLMVSPNPQHFIGETASYVDHRTETGIDGLYYQQTPAVLNSGIYKSGAGAAMLRNGKK